MNDVRMYDSLTIFMIVAILQHLQHESKPSMKIEKRSYSKQDVSMQRERVYAAISGATFMYYDISRAEMNVSLAFEALFI